MEEIERNMSELEARNPSEAMKKKQEELFGKIIHEKLEFNKRSLSNEDYLLKYLFLQIDVDRIGYVSKTEVFESVYGQEGVMRYFDLPKDTFFASIEHYQTARLSLMNFDEFKKFFRDYGQRNQLRLTQLASQLQKRTSDFDATTGERDSQRTRPDKSERDEKGYLRYEANVNKIECTEGMSTLSEPQVDLLRLAFIEVDRYNDNIVGREQLMRRIREDAKIKEILHCPAVKISIVNKIITLGQVLRQIESEYEQSNESGKQQLEYITWNQFYDYFRKYRPVKLAAREQESEDLQDESQIFTIDPEHLQLLKDNFDMLPRVQGDYASVADFVLSAKKDPQLKQIKNERCRLGSQETNIKAETISENLDRIVVEAGEYATWEELLAFMSKRGQPKDMMVPTDHRAPSDAQPLTGPDQEQQTNSKLSSPPTHTHTITKSPSKLRSHQR